MTQPLIFELTSLQIARRIADVVLVTAAALPDQSGSHVPDHAHAPTQAVLATLRELDLWWCRQAPLPPMEERRA